MSSTTSVQGAPYLVQTDAPDIAGITMALAQWVDTRVVMVFASVADRTAKLPVPSQGAFAYMQDTGRYAYFDGSAWRALNPRPAYSVQIAQPNFATTGSYVNFASNQWQSLTALVPPSGLIKVTISANILNTNTGTSTVWATWTCTSGTLTILNDFGDAPAAQGLSAAGSRVYGSKTVLCQASPNSTITLTPQWNISSGSAATAQITDGLLLIDPVA